MAEEKRYIPFDDNELKYVMHHKRADARFQDVMPVPGQLKVDWYLLRAMGKEIARRRTPTIELAMLTGDVVREFVPDVSPGTRHLGAAYKSLIMDAFRRRKHFVSHQSSASAATKEHTSNAEGEFRLI